MLEVTAVRKSFGSQQAVVDVSLHVAPGETVGLLGPNGAGKSTTVSMIAGLLAPDGGRVRIDGADPLTEPDRAKRAIGLVPQELALYDNLRADENLALFGALYDLSGSELKVRMGDALQAVGLSDRAQERVQTFSGGMKRRLNLAAALLHRPRLLLLDEPTVGVDPQSRNAIFERLEALRRDGLALVYTTHYMEEAARLCDRIVIVDHGRVVAIGTQNELLRLLPASHVLAIDFAQPPVDLKVLQSSPGVNSVEPVGSRIRVGLASLQAAPETLRIATMLGPPVEHFACERATLEDVFLHLTGRALRDA